MDTYILIRGARQLLTLHGPPGIRRGHAMNDLGVIEDGSVLIRNDQIAAVGPTRRLENLREARDAAVIPANGRVVMPGFIDPDLRVSSGAAERSARRQNLGRMAQETSSLLRAALQHGTTRAEIKLGGSTPLEELKALKSAKRLGDRGEQFVGTWRARPLAGETAKDAIESRRPHFEYVSRKMRNSFLEVETRSETVESAGWLFGEGARRRLPVKLSWIGGSEEALLDLLAAFSPRTISRLQPATERLAAALLENQTILTMGGGEPALRQDARAFCVREFVNANGGIALSSGYDPFESPTFNMQMTIALAVARMELTPEEAITAATVNAAYAIGAGPQVGTLETGKQADLLVLNLTSYGDLPRQFGINHVGMAIRAGEVVFNRIGWKPPRLESGGSRTWSAMVECVPNFSEGRNAATLDALERAIGSVPGTTVLHRTSDVDHNRSVFTFAGDPASVAESAFRAASVARDLIDLRKHSGAHPRLGALDVLPFVPLEGSSLEQCVDLAHETGERIWRELSVPVYFYEAAAKRPERRKLEDVRRGEFELLRDTIVADEARRPDVGGPGLHPSAGAVIVGARKFLIAFNINLRTGDVSVAKQIARRIRASSGGLPAIKALGLSLPSRRLVQVSMNLTDFEQTGLDTVFLEVARLAAEHGVEIVESELIGMMPRRALEMAAAGLLKLSSFDPYRVVENRLEALSGFQGGAPTFRDRR